MYVKCQQKFMVFLNLLIRSNINRWIIYFLLMNKLTSKLYINPMAMGSCYLELDGSLNFFF